MEPAWAATGATNRRQGLTSGAAAAARRDEAERAAHRLLLEVDRLGKAGVTSRQALARMLTERGMPTPRGGETWTHTTVGRLLARIGVETATEVGIGNLDRVRQV